jgi:hypothetical protein
MDNNDIVEIQQLIALYSHAVDMPDQSLFPQVFTEDAVFDGRPCGSPVYEGRAAIEAFFALGKPPHPLAHHMTNCWVREENGQALVRSKFIFRHPVYGEIHFGDYDDEVIRTGEGWRIRRRTVTPRDPPAQPGADDLSGAR